MSNLKLVSHKKTEEYNLSSHKKTEEYKLFSNKDIHILINNTIKALINNKSDLTRFNDCEFEGHKFFVKICFYHILIPEPGITSKYIIHQSEMEYKALQLMNEILDKNYLDTIIRLYHVHIIDDLSIVTPNNTKCHQMMLERKRTLKYVFCQYNHLIQNGLALNKCSFLFLEMCDLNLTVFLEKYIENSINYEIFKSILFQIIFTIYVITKIYPGFHHYDLHTDNIMLKIDDNVDLNELKYIEYTVENKKYYLPYFGITIRIIDFENAAIPEKHIISRTTEDRITMYQRPNNDIVFTLFWIYKIFKVNNLLSSKIEDTLFAIEPNQSYKYYEMHYIRTIEDKIPSYAKMLKCKLFKSFQEAKKDVIKSFYPV